MRGSEDEDIRHDCVSFQNSTDYNHIELALLSAAFGTDPIIGNVFPLRAGFNATIGIAKSFIVSEAAQHAFPHFEVATLGKIGGYRHSRSSPNEFSCGQSTTRYVLSLDCLINYQTYQFGISGVGGSLWIFVSLAISFVSLNLAASHGRPPSFMWPSRL
jgi:hypothetical protein